jgi:hypothetical protein
LIGRCQFVDKIPKGIVDLEIVGLVAAHVKESQVAGKIEIFSGIVDADGFAALPMQIAPIAAKLAIFDQQRSGLAKESTRYIVEYRNT